MLMFIGFLKILIFIICLIAGFYFAKVYQPQSKTVRIYKQALKDYDNGNYSNSYYLFSRVSNMSNLKPFAIYRQAMCAKAVGDKKSELKSYQSLLQNYKYSSLAAEAKYQAGQLLLEENSTLAKKYFQPVFPGPFCLANITHTLQQTDYYTSHK